MEATKEKKTTYERLSQQEGVFALVGAIQQLNPQRPSYRAANYVLACQQIDNNRIFTSKGMKFVLKDIRGNLICEAEISYSMEQDSVSVKLGPNQGDRTVDESYRRTKGALRQFLAAITFTDYTDHKGLATLVKVPCEK